MEIYIDAVRVEPSTSNLHGHITTLWWYTLADTNLKSILKQDLVNWLKASPDQRAFVKDANGKVEVHVVDAQPPYVQTVKDGVWANNLLALRRL